MRLFAGLDLPAPIQDNLRRLIDRFRSSARLRWSPVENLHITTKFIGEWPEERLDEIEAALAGVTGEPIPVAIRGLGWFPNPHNPRVFFAAVRAPESLVALARTTDEAVAAIGVEREKRPYAAHLTLARIGEPNTDLTALRRLVAGLDSDDFGEFTATTFHLYRSQTGPAGSVYTRLATFPLR
jgi:2'-5' RNA ligase